MAVALCLLAAVWAAGPVAPAEAYPQSAKICNDTSLDWRFNGNGTADQRNKARAAFLKLEDARSFDSTKLVDHNEIAAGLPITTSVKFENRPPGSYGFAECVGHKRILINNAYHTGQFIWKVARHEMFHLSGGQHAGNTDSMNGDNIPTMTTCLGYGQFRTVNALSQDDAAYLNWLHNDLSNRQLHANIGFEQGTSYWGKYNGSIVHYTSGGASSQSHISFYAYGTVNSSYVYQTVRLWTGNDNESYRAKLNARKTSIAHSAQVKARILRKTMTQGSSTCGSYADGITTANDPVITGGYINLSSSAVTALSGTGWQSRVSSWVNPANTDGLQLQVRAYARAETATSGVTRRIYLDNVRGEGT